MWQYKSIAYKRMSCRDGVWSVMTNEQIDAEMNKLGEAGWEAYAVERVENREEVDWLIFLKRFEV